MAFRDIVAGGLAATLVLACGGAVVAPESTIAAVRLARPSANFAVTVGQTLAMPLEPVNGAGVRVAYTLTPTYESRNPSVATVDDHGRVTVVDAGFAWIVGRAMVGARQLSDSVLVTGVCTLELTIRFEPAQPTVRVGEQIAPQVRRFGCGGRHEITTPVRWEAMDTTIAVFDATGRVATGRRPGTTLIRFFTTAPVPEGAIVLQVTP